MDFNSTVKGSALEGFYPAGWDFAKIDACVGAPETVCDRQSFWNSAFQPVQCETLGEFETYMGHEIAMQIKLAADRKGEFYPFISSCPNVLECNCVTGIYSMLIKVSFPSTQELDAFIGRIQRFGNTSTQIVFSTPVPHREINVDSESDN